MASFTPKRASPFPGATTTRSRSMEKTENTSASPTSPGIHITTLRERLKAKYRKFEEAKGTDSDEASQGMKDSGIEGTVTPIIAMEEEDQESDDVVSSDVDDTHHVDVELVSPVSLQRRLKEKREKKIFTKIDAEDVDALAAMSMAQDVMLAGDEKVKESKLLSKKLPESTSPENNSPTVERVDPLDDVKATRKEMKGSLLLTMILTQVYNVYANKISRAFYRWKHRYGSDSVKVANKSPVKDR